MKQVNFLKRTLLAIAALLVLNHANGQLSGTYTIGGASPDYATITAAVNDINANGVSAPVTFDIRPGIYTEQVSISNITGASATNRITFQSETGNVADVTVRFGPTSTANNYIIRLNNASYITIKNISVTTTVSNRGRLIEMRTNASYNIVDGCNLDAVGTSSNMAGIYATSLRGTDNVITNNRFTRGYYGIYFRGSSNSHSNSIKNTVIENNRFENVGTYSNYLYYHRNITVRGNTITKQNNGTHYGARMYYCNDGMDFTENTITFAGTGTRYGLYAYYNDNGMSITNNKITITQTSTKYGLRLRYNDGNANNYNEIINNVIAIDNGASTAYGIYDYYGRYQNIFNNSISVNSTSTTSVAARFYYSSSTYRYNKIFNNAFANLTGSGYTLYIYRVNYNNEWDYNNIYNGSNKLVQAISPAGTFNTLSNWNVAYKQDAHSISYHPGFTGITNLEPDANNPASWSLNGRGVHINANTTDINGNTRTINRADGVPDIGAYEFAPTVDPPLATATPSNPDPGMSQVFTFGQREVATVKWGVSVPTGNVEVRQYSGEKGAGVAAAANPAGSMYFHTDIKTSGSSVALEMDLKVNYMDIWLGGINTESNLKMAHKIGNGNWNVYNDVLSNVDINTDIIDAKLYNMGSYTGLENGSIQSAFIFPKGKLIICQGNSVTLEAEPKTGSFYKWYLGGVAIPGAEGANMTSYVATQAGSYTVEITQGGKIVESSPMPISVIAAPNAVITSNGALTYCTGNGLALNAGNTPGVTYQWQLNGVNISGANSSIYPVAQAGQYTVVATNIGCSSVSTPTAVNAGPLNVDLGNDTTYCEQKNIFSTLDAGFPGATYIWSTGETTQTIQPKQTGDYWVRVDAGPNCVDVDTLRVTIDPLPEAQGISFVQNGNTYKFFASGTVGVTGYMWLFSDGTSSTQSEPVKTLSTDELYVRMVLFNACGTDTVQLGWPLTIDNIDTDKGISIYPNPAKDNITIKMTGSENLQSITIMNAVGAVVSRVDNVQNTEHTINVSSLPTGSYILNAQTSDAIISKKINIVR